MRSFFYSIALSFLLVAPATTFAASLSISPSAGTYTIGDKVTVKVFISSASASINAVSGALRFPSIFSVESISKSSSVLNFWPSDPSVSQNTATFEGVALAGFQGSPGTVVVVTLRAARAGMGDITFQSGQVLANDGQGTDITSGLSGGTFSVKSASVSAPAPSAPGPAPTQAPEPAPAPLAPQKNLTVTSSTHPDPTRWYGNAHVILDWTNDQGTTAVRLGYDKNADGSPVVLYSDPISHKELDLTDGIWYFHVREKGPDGWSTTYTFRIQIDTVAPLPTAVQFPNGTTTPDKLAVLFATDDELSGIDHYQLSVGGKQFLVSAQEGAGIYTLPAQSPGAYTLVVVAYDKAGNQVTAQGNFVVTQTVHASAYTLFSLGWLAVNYLSLALVGLAVFGILLFAGWYLFHHFHLFRKREYSKVERAHALVHKQFTDLKNAVAREVRALEKVKSKRQLSVEEERLINRLQKLIDKAESTITKIEHRKI